MHLTAMALAAMIGVMMIATTPGDAPARGAASALVTDWSPGEPLSAALAAGRLHAGDVQGREVFAYDETRLGTVYALSGSDSQRASAATVDLDHRLGFGQGCIAAPITLLSQASEGRLVLIFLPAELRAAAEARQPCRH